ncbi:MAG: ATP-dependent DNA helicase, partial [Bacteroidetes bacterium]
RLFYVAITRAESHLVLTYSASRYRYGKQRFNQPSRFLAEIGEQHLDSSSPHGSVARAPFGRFETRMGQSPKKSSSGAKVQGNFKRGTQRKPEPVVNPADFKPSPPDQIQTGMKVLHLLFGEGKVLSIDGARDNRVATIFFKDVDGGSQKRILLKFAKLQVID